MGNKDQLTNQFKLSISIIVFILMIILLALFLNQNNSKLVSDETIFYPSLVKYNAGQMTLKTSDLPQTGLYLIIFGPMLKFFNGDLIQLRLFNYIIFMIVIFILIINAKRHSELWKALLLLAITPYLLFMSMSIYTDMLFILTLLLGFVAYEKKYYFLSFIGFTLAIFTRQFGIVFPAALALIMFFRDMLHPGQKFDSKKWIYPLLACLTLIIPFIYFNFHLNPLGVQGNIIGFNYLSGFMFIATIGAFYTIPKILLFSKTKDLKFVNDWRFKTFLFTAGIILILVLLPIQTQSRFLLMSQWHWLYYLITAGPLIAALSIAVLSALAFCYTSRSRYVTTVLILSTLMFSFMDWFFDKYAVPYVIVFIYLFLTDYKAVKKE